MEELHTSGARSNPIAQFGPQPPPAALPTFHRLIVLSQADFDHGFHPLPPAQTLSGGPTAHAATVCLSSTSSSRDSASHSPSGAIPQVAVYCWDVAHRVPVLLAIRGAAAAHYSPPLPPQQGRAPRAPCGCPVALPSPGLLAVPVQPGDVLHVIRPAVTSVPHPSLFPPAPSTITTHPTTTPRALAPNGSDACECPVALALAHVSVAAALSWARARCGGRGGGCARQSAREASARPQSL